MPTDASLRALKILRDGSQFQWYVIPFLMLVLYIYTVEVERRNWNLVFAGLAFWGMDWFNEIWNGLVFHFTQYAPVWGAPGRTAYLILIGLNIEICFMFACAGIVVAKTLPADKSLKILGVPNRLVHCGMRIRLLRHRGVVPERGGRPDLGLLVVEHASPVADPRLRVPDLLRRVVLGLRHAERQEEGADGRDHLRVRRRVPGRVRGYAEVDLTTTAERRRCTRSRTAA